MTPGAGQFARSAVEVLRASERVAEGAGILVAPADEATTIPALLFPPTARAFGARTVARPKSDALAVGPLRRDFDREREKIQGMAVYWRYSCSSRGADAETSRWWGRAWIVSGPRTCSWGRLSAHATSLLLSAFPLAVRYPAARCTRIPGRRTPFPARAYTAGGVTRSRAWRRAHDAHRGQFDALDGGQVILHQGRDGSAPWWSILKSRVAFDRWASEDLDARRRDKARVAKREEWVGRPSAERRHALVVPSRLTLVGSRRETGRPTGGAENIAFVGSRSSHRDRRSRACENFAGTGERRTIAVSRAVGCATIAALAQRAAGDLRRRAETMPTPSVA